MANNEYIVFQNNAGDTSYAFKALLKGYRPEVIKTQRERYTITGKLDVQVAPSSRMWEMVVKLYGTASGTFSISAGPNGIIQADSSVSWGTKDDLISLFDEDTPPNNKLRFQDFDGEDYWVYFTGRMTIEPRTTSVDGNDAYMRCRIVIRESVE